MKSRHYYSERNVTLKSMGFESYNQYLKSPLWKSIRERVHDRVGKVCEICGRASVVIHHTSYDIETLKGNTIEHLHPLCLRCNKKVEFNGRGNKRSFTSALRKFFRMVRKRRSKVKPQVGGIMLEILCPSP